MTTTNSLKPAAVPAFAPALPAPCAPATPGRAALAGRLRPRRAARRRGGARVVARVAAPREGRPAADDGLGDAGDAEPDDLPEWDGLVSDDTHVVVDGAEIAHLIEELRRTGADELGATALDDDSADHPDASSQRVGFPGVDMALLNLAERRADERAAGVRPAAPAVAGDEGESTGAAAQSAPVSASASASGAVETEASTSADPALKAGASETPPPPGPAQPSRPGAGVMQYFADEHVGFMPSWAREMYANDTHDELQRGASVLVPDTSRERLHEIVAQGPSAGGAGASGVPLGERDAAVVDAESGTEVEPNTDADEGDDRGAELRHAGRGTGAGGLVDCRVRDVAEDYGVPEEFVVDALDSFGVAKPISGGTSVRDSMTGDEIVRLLKLITSFDAVDLADRYSDRSIAELAEYYDLDAEDVLAVCRREGLYVHAGVRSRLSVVREDRVLDILLKGAPFGKPYPSPLDGLE